MEKSIWVILTFALLIGSVTIIAFIFQSEASGFTDTFQNLIDINLLDSNNGDS